MATRTPTSAAKRGAAAASGGSAATPSSSSHQRAPSPARLSRVHEKEQLIDLNDRLATYIDRVRQLEGENGRLTVQIRSCTESSQKEVVELRAMFQAELASARKLLDETSKENAKLQIELGKARAEADELRTRFARRDRDATVAERRAAQLETELAASRPERDALRAELGRALQDLETLRRQYETCKKQLEDETLLRVDMQNQIQTLKEDMHFTQELHSRELEKSLQINSTVHEEQVSRYQAEYEAKLEEAIKELREQYSVDLRQARDDANAIADRRVKEIQAASERQTQFASAAREESLTLRRRSDELAAELASAQQENAALQKRIAELEAAALRERADWDFQLAALRAEIDRLQRLLADREQEYQELYDVKVQLDYEIGVYQKLLEAEEVRLNLSDSESPAQKRRRVGFVGAEETSTEADRSDAKNYEIENTTQSNVEFTELELSAARFIRLSNSSSEDVALGGATLRHRVGECETTYKFSKQLVLKAGSAVTVYSSDTGVTHNPPSELVMKNQKWTLGDDMHSVLLSAKGDQLCSLHMRLRATERLVTTSRRVHRSVNSVSGTSQKSEQCSLM